MTAPADAKVRCSTIGCDVVIGDGQGHGAKVPRTCQICAGEVRRALTAAYNKRYKLDARKVQA